MVVGVALALYVGVWLLFIGGIVQIVDAVKATPVSGLDIALGILRVIFAGAGTMLTMLFAVFPGYAMLKQ